MLSILAGGFLFNLAASAHMVINPQADPPQKLGPQPPVSAPDDTKFIVTFTPATSRKQRADAVRNAGAGLRFNYSIINAAAVTATNNSIVNALKSRPDVLRVDPDRKLALDAVSPPPGSPTGLQGNYNGTGVVLEWTDNSDEEGFSVERCTGAGCTAFAQIATTGSNVNTYTDAAVVSNSTYGYRVFAFRTSGPPASRVSGFSNAVEVTTASGSNTAPDAASGLIVSGTTSASISMGWTDNSNNEDLFKVERCTGSGCGGFAVVGTTAPNVNFYTDAAVTSSTTYRYRIVASNAAGDAQPSNVVDATSEPIVSAPAIQGRQIVPSGNQRVGRGAWTGAGVGIAIVDTGLDQDHPDLNVAPEHFDFDPSANVYGSGEDDHGHGTHIGGIAAAIDNNIGILGVAPAATLYAVKVVDALGQSEDSLMIAGLDWIATNRLAVDPPISVVNMSLGRPLESGDLNGPLRQAI